MGAHSRDHWRKSDGVFGPAFLDRGGLRIATTLLAHVPWRSWRYTAHDYRAAVAAVGPDRRPLDGKPAPSPWDPDLAPALTGHALRVEEAVLDVLLKDLEGGQRPRNPWEPVGTLARRSRYAEAAFQTPGKPV
ncbi:DUF2399 domain-containing protein [Streptomyces sp. NPDC014623]|uniref:DUF2399 domain-containing protein n=1 Tax=Streptomyces sp. NPDC014623 TaxID=3364875 RepID=UPI0037010E6C